MAYELNDVNKSSYLKLNKVAEMNNYYSFIVRLDTNFIG